MKIRHSGPKITCSLVPQTACFPRYFAKNKGTWNIFHGYTLLHFPCRANYANAKQLHLLQRRFDMANKACFDFEQPCQLAYLIQVNFLTGTLLESLSGVFLSAYMDSISFAKEQTSARLQRSRACFDQCDRAHTPAAKLNFIEGGKKRKRKIS